MTDPTQGRQPTQEELEAHLAQLRQADAAEVVAQAVNMLATGAQVKLGRSDARVLIDAISGVADACDGRISGDFVQQVRDAVSQLQMAQVQAEREGAGETGPGDGGQAGAEPAGQGGRSAPGPGDETGGPAGPGGGQEGGQRMTDRLWIPGREPGPG